ncbi:TVP38/TMEM64 family protein [Desulfobacterota bacterium AH_259_B03_O07]|nr:TVP38/TMEM64 family protein [Desulfobacterota bacterium AH_259_B03_O07]
MDVINRLDEINKKRILQILILVLIVLTVFLLLRVFDIRFKDLTASNLRDFLLSFGFVKGAILYIVIYTFSLRPFIPIPPTLYTLAGGFTFGPVWGTILTVTGATLNASVSFLLARSLGKDFVHRISRGKLDRINEILKENSFKSLLIIRTSPIGPPFDLVSYGSGVLRVSFWNYFFATLIGIIPATAVYSYFGGSISKGGWAILVGFFLVVVIAVILPWFLKRRKKG